MKIQTISPAAFRARCMSLIGLCTICTVFGAVSAFASPVDRFLKDRNYEAAAKALVEAARKAAQKQDTNAQKQIAEQVKAYLKAVRDVSYTKPHGFEIYSPPRGAPVFLADILKAQREIANNVQRTKFLDTFGLRLEVEAAEASPMTLFRVGGSTPFVGPANYLECANPDWIGALNQPTTMDLDRFFDDNRIFYLYFTDPNSAYDTRMGRHFDSKLCILPLQRNTTAGPQRFYSVEYVLTKSQGNLSTTHFDRETMLSPQQLGEAVATWRGLVNDHHELGSFFPHPETRQFEHNTSEARPAQWLGGPKLDPNRVAALAVLNPRHPNAEEIFLSAIAGGEDLSKVAEGNQGFIHSAALLGLLNGKRLRNRSGVEMLTAMLKSKPGPLSTFAGDVLLSAANAKGIPPELRPMVEDAFLSVFQAPGEKEVRRSYQIQSQNKLPEEWAVPLWEMAKRPPPGESRNEATLRADAFTFGIHNTGNHSPEFQAILTRELFEIHPGSPDSLKVWRAFQAADFENAQADKALIHDLFSPESSSDQIEEKLDLLMHWPTFWKRGNQPFAAVLAPRSLEERFRIFDAVDDYFSKHWYNPPEARQSLAKDLAPEYAKISADEWQQHLRERLAADPRRGIHMLMDLTDQVPELARAVTQSLGAVLAELPEHDIYHALVEKRLLPFADATPMLRRKFFEADQAEKAARVLGELKDRWSPEFWREIETKWLSMNDKVTNALYPLLKQQPDWPPSFLEARVQEANSAQFYPAHRAVLALRNHGGVWPESVWQSMAALAKTAKGIASRSAFHGLRDRIRDGSPPPEALTTCVFEALVEGANNLPKK